MILLKRRRLTEGHTRRLVVGAAGGEIIVSGKRNGPTHVL